MLTSIKPGGSAFCQCCVGAAMRMKIWQGLGKVGFRPDFLTGGLSLYFYDTSQLANITFKISFPVVLLQRIIKGIYITILNYQML